MSQHVHSSAYSALTAAGINLRARHPRTLAREDPVAALCRALTEAGVRRLAFHDDDAATRLAEDDGDREEGGDQEDDAFDDAEVGENGGGGRGELV